MNWRLRINIFLLPLVSFVLSGCVLHEFRNADDIHEFSVFDSQTGVPLAIEYAYARYGAKERVCAGLPVYGRTLSDLGFDMLDKYYGYRVDRSLLHENTVKYEIRNLADDTISTVEILDKYLDARENGAYKIRETSRYILKNGGELKADCTALIGCGSEFKIEKIAYFYGENQDFREITKEEFFAKKEELIQSEERRGK